LSLYPQLVVLFLCMPVLYLGRRDIYSATIIRHTPVYTKSDQVNPIRYYETDDVIFIHGAVDKKWALTTDGYYVPLFNIKNIVPIFVPEKPGNFDANMIKERNFLEKIKNEIQKTSQPSNNRD